MYTKKTPKSSKIKAAGAQEMIFYDFGTCLGAPIFLCFWNHQKGGGKSSKNICFPKRGGKAINNPGSSNGVGAQFYLKGHSRIRSAIFVYLIFYIPIYFLSIHTYILKGYRILFNVGMYFLNDICILKCYRIVLLIPIIFVVYIYASSPQTSAVAIGHASSTNTARSITSSPLLSGTDASQRFRVERRMRHRIAGCPQPCSRSSALRAEAPELIMVYII